MCQLLWAVTARELVEPITLGLDNARYQRNAIVRALARQLGIELFLPSYSPNRNLSERLWPFTNSISRSLTISHFWPREA